MVGSWTDWELNETGREQAEHIGKNLSAELFGQNYKIFSSDLLRAMQTADPLARYLGVRTEPWQALREHNAGEAVGKSGEWARANSKPLNSFDDRQFNGAESWREFWNRVSGVCHDVLACEAENIVLVSHGVTLSVWQQIWSGLDITEFKYLGCPGGVSFFQVNNDGTRETLRLNDTKYMTE
jgi:Fructose-2,6-bisphosphatase